MPGLDCAGMLGAGARSAATGIVLGALLAACTVSEGHDAGRPEGGFRVDGGSGDAAVVPDAGVPPDAFVDLCMGHEGPATTLGQPCSESSECDDHCFCNGVERCTGAVCVAGDEPCTDAVPCTADRCLEETDNCVNRPDHSMCQDGDACNGSEQCVTVGGDGRGCTLGAELYCNDENACTIDSCDPAHGCVFTPKDLDHDGFGDVRCGGEDCDDDPRTGRDIHPGAVEICDNRRDDDCDTRRDYLDSDCLPTNDTCSNVQVLPGAGTHSGSTRGLNADYTLGCSTLNGADAVFQFTLTEPHDVAVTAAGGSTTFGEGMAITLRSTCAAGPEIRCGTGDNIASVRQRSLAAGTYYVIVKTIAPTEFDLTLRITDPTVAPRTDICNPMTDDVSRGGSFTGMFDEVEDDFRLDCNTGGSYRDAAYRLTLTTPKDVVITAQTTGSFTPITYLALTTDCANASARLACQSGFFSPAEIRRRNLPAGTYYILVESSDATAISWTLNVVLTDPSARTPSDSCSPVLDITDTMQTVSIGAFELDVGTSCGGSDPSFRDAIFDIDLPDTRDVTLTTRSSLGAYFYVSLTPTTCGAVGMELRCSSGLSPLNMLFRSLPAGHYYVVVSTATGGGTLSAQATTAVPTPIPPDDRCTGATALDLSTPVSVMGTTLGYGDDGTTRCGGTGRLDRYYSFTLATRRNVRAFLTPDAPSATMTLEIETTCGSAATDPARCRNGSGSSPASLNATLDPGTYYFVVESPESSAGAYTLDVLTSAA